jgi:phage shock protein PspC (stress-responsive transcriptional regulator)
MIGGVAGGIAESLRIDPTLVRLVWVLLAFATNGLLVLVYFVLLFVVPEAPEEPGAVADASGAESGAEPGAAGAAGASTAPAMSPSPSRARASGPSADGRTGALVAGAILVLVGGYFLVRQYLPSIDLSLNWQFVAVGLGVILIVASLRPGGRSG